MEGTTVRRKEGIANSQTIVLVDAFADEAEMYSVCLANAGFRVALYDSPAAALSDVQHSPPAVVVARLRFPHLHFSGIAFVRQLKADVRTRHVPAVIASTGPGDRGPAVEAGCDSYILLPCEPDGLIAEIARLVRSA